MNGFHPVPNATFTYDGLEYGEQYPSQAEIEFECHYLHPDEITVAGVSLDPGRALQLLEFLERPEEDGPIPGLTLAIRWFIDDRSSPVGAGALEEAVSWLRYTLGIDSYEGSYDVWEG